MEEDGAFGRPVRQSGSNGPEILFACPLCVADGRDSKGRMLRVARRLDGGDLPYIGCRQHDGPGDWKRLRKELTRAGVPAELLSAASGHSTAGEGVPRSESRSNNRHGFPDRLDGLGESEPVDIEQIDEWCERLASASGVRYRRYLHKRGLTDETIAEAQLGLGAFVWTKGKQPVPRITIPIFDADGNCVNVQIARVGKGTGPKRLALPHPTRLREKAAGEGDSPDKFEGYGSPARLYGVDMLAADRKAGGADPIFVVGGEWDRLLAVQNGLLAVAPTSGEGSLPRAADAQWLADREVVICLDCDAAGRKAAQKWARACLAVGAESVRVVDLDVDRSDGYDLSDWFSDGGDVADLYAMAEAAGDWEDDGTGDEWDGPLLEMSDLGLAENVLWESGSDLRYVAELQAWIAWDAGKGVWQEFGRGDLIAPAQAVYRYVRRIRREFAGAEKDSIEEDWHKYVKQYLNVSGSSSAVRAMSTVPETRVSIVDLDAKVELLNLANGTASLLTGELYEPLAADLLTKRTNGAWLERPAGSGSAQIGEWADFLDRFVPDAQTQRWLQAAVGYSLLDGNPRRLLIILKGPGGTGKTTFAEILQRVLGPYAGPINLSLFRDSQDERPRADLVTAMTRRIVFASETSAAWKLHVDQLKRLTGNETIAARLPHSPKLYERRPAFTPWVLTNDTPTVDGVDAPFFRRLAVVPFSVVIPEADEGADYVNDVFEMVRDEVMTWALEGLSGYLSAGAKLPAKSREMMLVEMEVREQFNSLTVFLAEYTRQAPDARVPSGELYGAYTDYCDVSGIPERDRFNKIEFGRRLRKLGPYRACKWDSGTVRGWSGLKLLQSKRP
jgi:putative DNA primase/helicase